MPEGQTDIQVIEKLESDVLGTTQELQNLQGSINGLNAEEKAQVISENSQMLLDIQRTIKACREECNRLEQENKAENAARLNQLKANLAKLEQIYTQVNQQVFSQTNADLNQLSNDTIANQNQNQSEQNQENPNQKEPEKKGIRGWWKGLTDGQRRGIRIAGGVGVGLGIFGLLRRRRKKQETTTAVTTPTNGLSRREARIQRRNARRAKPFWDRPIGKAIKWTAIGGGVYWLVHKLVTGKSNPLDRKNDTPVNDAESVYNYYVEMKEKDPEKYKEYEDLGNNINGMYDSIWDAERQYLGADNQIVLGKIGNDVEEKKLQRVEKFEHVDTRGLVPFALDNFYDNVGEMMSHGGVQKYIRCKNIQEYENKIKEFGAEWFDRVMVPYLSTFASFASFGIVSTDSASEKMHKYFEKLGENAQERQAELDLFFRQYMKVLTYVADKKNAVALKEAKKIISVEGYDGSNWPTNENDQKDMLLEAINDKDWVKKNLEGTSYGAFMSSKLVGASKILKNEGLSESESTDELQEIIDDADGQTKKILGGSFENNAFTEAENKLNNGGSLSSSETSGLKKIADNVVKDLGETKETSWRYDTFDYAFEALGLEEHQKQILLEQSGLDKSFANMVDAIKKLRTEVITNPTKENVEKLKNAVGEYTSMKKELAVALYGIKEAKENKDFLDYVKQFLGAVCTFFGHFRSSLKKCRNLKGDIGDITNVFLGLTVTGGALCFYGKVFNKNWAVRVGNRVKNIGLGPITIARMGLGRTNMGWAVKGRINQIGKYDFVHAQNVLEREILDGTLSPRQVRKIISQNEKMYNGVIKTVGSDQDVYTKVVKKVFEDKGLGLSDDAIDLFAKYNRDIKGLVSFERTGVTHNGLRGGYTITNVDNLKSAYPELKVFDEKIAKMAEGPQKKYLQSILKKCGTAGTISEDLKFVNKLSNDADFLRKLGTDDLKFLKKMKLSELRALDESGDLGKFVRGEKNIGELLDGVPRLNRQAENLTRKVFNQRIDDEIAKIKRIYGENAGTLEKNTIKRLKSLKRASHTDDEIKAFMTMMDKGFEPKFFSQIDNMFKLEHEGRMIGQELKKLLVEGEYGKFVDMFRTESKANGSLFKKAGVVINESSDICIIKHLNKVFEFDAIKGLCKVDKPLIKAFAKIVAKVL